VESVGSSSREVRLGAPFNVLNADQEPVRQGAPYGK
jgi:hypothetical protein